MTADGFAACALRRYPLRSLHQGSMAYAGNINYISGVDRAQNNISNQEDEIMEPNNDDGAELPDQPESRRRREILGAIAAGAAFGALPGAAFAQGPSSPAKAAAEITDQDRAMLREAWTGYCNALRREGED